MISRLQKKDQKKIFLNILISLIPLSFILGNTAINLNFILILLTAIIFYQRDLFNLKYLIIDKILFIFFTIMILTGFYNDIFYLKNDMWLTGYDTILKSIFFLRFLLLFIVIRYLIHKDLIYFQYFFISCALGTTFVCLDLFYQAVFNVDIFGYQPVDGIRKLAGPFGDEYIAGSYIQRFSLFTFFLFPFFKIKNYKKLYFFLIPLFFIIFLSGIILSGNRMPFILYLLTVFLTLLYIKDTRKYFFFLLMILPLIFVILYNSNSMVKNNYNNLYNNYKEFKKVLNSSEIKNQINNEDTPSYIGEFVTFYDTWLMNKYFGGGIKNFRYYCHHRPNIEKYPNLKCNMHPHNYYLEILTETGIVGFLIISALFFIILYNSIIKNFFNNYSNKNKYILVPFMFLFFSEIFPIKTTGSFFTTGNSSYIFLLMAITVGLSIKYNLIEKN